MPSLKNPVTSETLYEAIATALAALQQDNWVGEIGQGFTTVTVVVQQPPVKHEPEANLVEARTYRDAEFRLPFSCEGWEHSQKLSSNLSTKEARIPKPMCQSCFGLGEW